MITREQALTANMFHAEPCTKQRQECWRRNGKTKTLKRQPEYYSVPVKHGLYHYGYITPAVADKVHVAEECPYATT